MFLSAKHSDLVWKCL